MLLTIKIIIRNRVGGQAFDQNRTFFRGTIIIIDVKFALEIKNINFGFDLYSDVCKQCILKTSTTLAILEQCHTN